MHAPGSIAVACEAPHPLPAAWRTLSLCMRACRGPPSLDAPAAPCRMGCLGEPGEPTGWRTWCCAAWCPCCWELGGLSRGGVQRTLGALCALRLRTAALYRSTLRRASRHRLHGMSESGHEACMRMLVSSTCSAWKRQPALGGSVLLRRPWTACAQGLWYGQHTGLATPPSGSLLSPLPPCTGDACPDSNQERRGADNIGCASLPQCSRPWP